MGEKMKRTGRVLGKVLAAMLAVFALQAMADTQMAGRDFDHMNTGFPLVGGHATAACEICHVAGVFKGTPRNCDNCHALGRRVVATPKPTNHIVTDAPCESCHFNTFTFLGARYNHGTALPGQCATCHNGTISTGRPASHNVGLKATGSCDSCHRSYSFLPASWNHVGVIPGSCANAGCHVQGANQYYRSTATHVYNLMRNNACDDCHNVISWTPRHIAPTKLCNGCHNDADAKGPASFAGHVAITATQNCTDCHTTTTMNSVSWAGALGATPAGHVTYTPGVPCTVCHTGTTVATGAALHAYLSQTACNSCHYKGAVVYAPNHPPQQSSHQGNVTCSSSSCHAPLGRKGTAYINWD